jgi:SAM-dependent methyltransferase
VPASAPSLPSPELVELWDADRIRTWQDYHLSGIGEMISAANLCHALHALATCGLLDRLRADRPVPVDDLLTGLDPHLATGFLRYLAVCGVLEEHRGGYRLSGRGRLLTTDVALARLGFYLEAYGPVVRRAADLLDRSATYGVDVVRDHGALGRRSGTVSTVSYVPIVAEAMRGRSATRLVDLGCGDGSLLIQACLRDPTLTGTGLDIAPAAIEAARTAAGQAGVADRARFSVADAFDPATWPASCDTAEVISGVGVLHEKFRDGDDAVVELLNVLGKRVAGERMLLIGEPELRYDNRENDSDFYLVHVLTGQGIPRDRDGWLAVFARSELRCRRVYTSAVAGPRTCFYELVPRGD